MTVSYQAEPLNAKAFLKLPDRGLSSAWIRMASEAS